LTLARDLAAAEAGVKSQRINLEVYSMDHEQAFQLSIDLMKSAETAYFSTVNNNGFPETRAMLNLRNSKQYPDLALFFRGVDATLETYFTTNTLSLKTETIKANPKICVYYCRPSEWRGLMLCGLIEIVSDINIKKKLWQEAWTLYYPQGTIDSDYTILRLKPSLIKGYHQLQSYHFELRGEL